LYLSSPSSSAAVAVSVPVAACTRVLLVVCDYLSLTAEGNRHVVL
jgi:hypothetical protein